MEDQKDSWAEAQARKEKLYDAVVDSKTYTPKSKVEPSKPSKPLFLIKEFPTSKKDVLYCNDNNHKFNHRMDALNYCIENKIPFLVWNGIMVDWNCNIININYWDLSTEIKPSKPIPMQSNNIINESLLIKESIEKYVLSIDVIKKLIAKELNVQDDSIKVEFKIEEVGADPMDRYPGNFPVGKSHDEVTKVIVTVKK
jgi:hypothetical protein